MNSLEKILYMLQIEMNEPEPYGWFHILWICFIIISLLVLFKLKKHYSDKQLKFVLGSYGIVALILEIIKQLIWSFNYDSASNLVTWDYQWYAAPFQLCTTPIFISLICIFLNNNKIREALLSYMAFVTIWGSIMTVILPADCLVSDVVINIHTMWLHCGSLVVSIYLLINGVIKVNKQNLKNAFVVFVIFVFIAELLNVCVYNMNILNGEEFNMFYISPYFVSGLPVFSVIQQNVPFIIYLLIYMIAIFIGSLIIYGISYGLQKLSKKKTNNTCK